MASIDKRPNGQWRARWREFPGGPQKTKQFTKKVDAERFLVKIQHDLMAGTYVAPDAAKTTLEDYYRSWFQRVSPSWRVSTAATVENSFVKYVIPTFGKRPLTSIRRADVETWAATLKVAPSTVGVMAQHFGQMLRAAVDDGLIPNNPASRARLPRKEVSKAQPVSLDVIARIEATLPDWMRVAVPLGVGAGLRQGEASGLTVDRVQFLRRTLLVDRQLICRHVPEPTLAAPKTSSSVRTVPLAAFVVEALSAHLTAFPAQPADLVLRRPGGSPVDADTFGNYWRRACRAAGAPGLRYHDLRHTFASTLLSRGVSVKAVADWLGHASPVVTLTTYAHLMPTDEEVARSVLDAAMASAMASPAGEPIADTGA